MYKHKIRKPDMTIIHAAALQDHILRNANLVLNPIQFKPQPVKVIESKLPKQQCINSLMYFLRESIKFGSRGSQRIKLPKLDNKFHFEIEEEQAKKEEEAVDAKIKDEYKKKLTLAQKLGLVAAPPKPMTLEDWNLVEDQSKARDEGLCPICLEKFKNQEHIILSCSHVFHQQCLDSFEKYNKLKQCPICRRQNYEKKRYVHAHRQFAISCAIQIQSFFRGYICRVKLFESLLSCKYVATSVRFRRRIMLYKLSKVTAKLHNNLDKRTKQIEKKVKDLGDQYEEQKQNMDNNINEIINIKQQNQQNIQDVLDNRNNENPGQISQDEWGKIKQKALKRCDKDCSICFQSLQNKKGVYLLSCSHMFHAACLNAFERYSIKTYQTCPLCRSEYSKIHMQFK